jgi:hypothetical protein
MEVIRQLEGNVFHFGRREKPMSYVSEDLENAKKAMVDAAKKAREIAFMHKAYVVYSRDGKIIFELWDGTEIIKDIPVEKDFDPLKK